MVSDEFFARCIQTIMDTILGGLYLSNVIIKQNLFFCPRIVLSSPYIHVLMGVQWHF